MLDDNLSSGEEEEDRGYRGDMDESDSDVPSSRHKTALPRHRSLHKDVLSKSTDTSESYYGDNRKRLSPKKRRLKSNRSRILPEPKESLVSFQGFKDLEDESAEPKVKSPRKETAAQNSTKESSPDAFTKEKSPSKETVNLQVESPKINADTAATLLTVEDTETPLFNVENLEIPLLIAEDTETSLLNIENTETPLFNVENTEASLLNVEDAETRLLNVENDLNDFFTEIKNPSEDIKINDIFEKVSDPSEVTVALTEENSLKNPMTEMYNSMQSYHPAYYNPQMFSAHSSMVNMTYQQTFFYQQYYPYWQQPPPPPPPPPPPDDDPQQDMQDSTDQPNSKDSGTLTMPEPQIDSSSVAQCNQHYDNNYSSLQQVHYFPTFSDQFPNTSEVPTHPDISSLPGESTEAHAKKKKKKSKKKKKKKKRKRKHSKLERESGKEQYSSASSGYDEWGVEYCSTLVENEPTEKVESPIPEAVPSETAQASSTFVTSNDPKLEPSLSKNEPESKTETKKESKLLLKIDKSKFVSTPSPEKDKSSSESSDEDALSSEDSKPNKPYITPLKLKLCGQKSDRTLRGGLVAREYQILESENSNISKSADSSTTKQTIITSPKTETKSLPVSNNFKSKVTKPPGKSNKTSQQKKANSRKHTVSKSPAQTLSTSNSGISLSANKVTDKIAGSQTVPAKQTNAVPERHWKKRKLHVHEASVTTNAVSGGKSPIKKAHPSATQTATSSSVSTSSNNNHFLASTSDTKPSEINHTATSLAKKGKCFVSCYIVLS